jgi:hypothetical protein
MKKVNSTDKKIKPISKNLIFLALIFIKIVNMLLIIFKNGKSSNIEPNEENTKPSTQFKEKNNSEEKKNSKEKSQIIENVDMKKTDDNQFFIVIDNQEPNFNLIEEDNKRTDEHAKSLDEYPLYEEEDDQCYPTQEKNTFQEEKKAKSEKEIQKNCSKEPQEKVDNGKPKNINVINPLINLDNKLDLLNQSNQIGVNIIADKSNNRNKKLLGNKIERNNSKQKTKKNDNDQKKNRNRKPAFLKEDICQRFVVIQPSPPNLIILNLRKESNYETILKCLKAPVQSITRIIENYGGHIKLNDPNLDDIFGNINDNKIYLSYKFYQILCEDRKKENKGILEKVLQFEKKEIDSKFVDKEKFLYFLTRRYLHLFRKFAKDDNEFEINGIKEKIEDFVSIKKYMENKLKNEPNSYKEKFKKISKDICNNLEGYIGRDNSTEEQIFECKKQIKIKILEDYFEKERNKYLNIKKINLELFNISLNEESNDKCLSSFYKELNLKNLFANKIEENKSETYFSDKDKGFNISSLDYKNKLHKLFPFGIPDNLNEILLS